MCNDKVRFGVVAPPHSELIGAGDFVFLQAGWIRDVVSKPKYVEWLRSVIGSKFVILDYQPPMTNGEKAQSAQTMTFDEYYEIAKLIEADEAVSPDVLYDGEATLTQFRRFAKMYGWKNPNIMYVPQGKTITEWIENYWEMHLSPYSIFVSTIGIPKWLSSHYGWEVRRNLTDVVNEEEYDIHFLGASQPQDFKFHPRVRSWDSSIPVALAQHNLKVDTPEAPKYDLDINSYVDPDLALYNVRKIQELLRGSQE